MEITPVLPDKNFLDISSDIWNFSQYFTTLFIYLFIYSTISCVSPDDVQTNPDWDTQV